ncbi:hypothetical protein GCM10025869_15280 [Homoserinibacter gongjuensis]|uniref:ABC transporter domain-containing protein n=1 Tax=Homoserinibacter gongjuensis TaxID=1162968 RepID=A0ABQ6JUP8_9MICO|nr:hypothetical protein GCM10025869_15280 [Homoserinibacter gongjuensis]
MLFQNYALFPHMTVAQNVAYPLRERRMSKELIAQKVAAVLELVQLTGRDDHYPTQLSGGQQQRVALARAIVFDPKALLLDEPLGALDRNLRGALQAEIRRIHREVGSTFVFVTHDQEEAMNLSDRIALFNQGHIEQVGSPEELYRRPETLFTARFLGDSNVFELAGERMAHAWAGRTASGPSIPPPSRRIPACGARRRSWCDPRTSGSRPWVPRCRRMRTRSAHAWSTSNTWARTAPPCSPSARQA